MGDWIITAGILAISLVLLLISLSLDARLRKLEKEVKEGMQKAPTLDDYVKGLEQEIKNLDEIQQEQYNPSYGNPEYTEWIDKDHDSKGVK